MQQQGQELVAPPTPFGCIARMPPPRAHMPRDQRSLPRSMRWQLQPPPCMAGALRARCDARGRDAGRQGEGNGHWKDGSDSLVHEMVENSGRQARSMTLLCLLVLGPGPTSCALLQVGSRAYSRNATTTCQHRHLAPPCSPSAPALNSLVLAGKELVSQSGDGPQLSLFRLQKQAPHTPATLQGMCQLLIVLGLPLHCPDILGRWPAMKARHEKVVATVGDGGRGGMVVDPDSVTVDVSPQQMQQRPNHKQCAWPSNTPDGKRRAGARRGLHGHHLAI